MLFLKHNLEGRKVHWLNLQGKEMGQEGVTK